MNVVRLKRLTVHFLLSFCLLFFIATPVFALTMDLTTSTEPQIMPINTPMPLKTAVTTKPSLPPPEEPPKQASVSAAISQVPISQVADVSITEIKVSETPTPTPTTPPAPTTVSPTASQTGSNVSLGGGLNADILFSLSNNYRTSHGLASFATDARVCTLAQERAPEIGAEIAEGHMHSGKNSHNFPYWFTENIISMNSEEAAFNWWINDPIHQDAIVGNYAYSCVACSGNSCVQEFTNFSPK